MDKLSFDFVAVLLAILGASAYLVRYVYRIAKGRSSGCPGCGACDAARKADPSSEGSKINPGKY